MPKLRCLRGVGSVGHARRALALVIALLALTSTPTHAETYDVCNSGCPYRTIQAAIEAANPGKVIRVGPGTYNENIVLRPRVSVAGAGQNETTIRGAGSQPVVRADDSMITRDTVVENLSITGGGGDRGGGLLVSSGAMPTVRNVTIRDNSTSQWGAGVVVQNGADLLLEGALDQKQRRAFGLRPDRDRQPGRLCAIPSLKTTSATAQPRAAQFRCSRARPSPSLTSRSAAPRPTTVGDCGSSTVQQLP